MLIRSLPAVALVAGCQGHSTEESPTAGPSAIEVRSGGKIAARIVPGHPCRATIEGIELLVGSAPLIAQVGEVRWSGAEGDNGTTIARDGVATARIYPTGPTGDTGVYAPEGITMIRAVSDGAGVNVVGGDGSLLRVVKKTPGGITVGDGTVTVSGTDDLVLAALLTAPEVGPEVRGLAACHRLLPLVKGS